MNKLLNYIALFMSLFLISFVIFYKWHGDTTGRYVTLLVSIVMQNSISCINEKIIKIINSSALIIIIVLTMILGFGFNYFKV